MGLVLKSFATESEMFTYIHTHITLPIATKSPLTIRGIKKTLLYTRDHNIYDSLQHIKMYNTSILYNTDLTIAMKAYMTKSKQPPKYDGV